MGHSGSYGRSDGQQRGGPNNDAAAINQPNAFINQVIAKRGSGIDEADADALIAAAEEIIDKLSEI